MLLRITNFVLVGLDAPDEERVGFIQRQQHLLQGILKEQCHVINNIHHDN